jgi:hypothetical protein
MINMTDRELLELAAKAAGIEHPGGDHSIYNDGRLWDCKGLRWWNPLTEDDDALGLVATLRLEIDHNHPADEKPWVCARGQKYGAVVDFDHESGRRYAIRRVIVQAAAEIGKAMVDTPKQP